MRRYFIDYPQEEDQGMHDYRCQHCKVNTRAINGLVENHLENCRYRLEMEGQPHIHYASAKPPLYGVDQTD